MHCCVIDDLHMHLLRNFYLLRRYNKLTLDVDGGQSSSEDKDADQPTKQDVESPPITPSSRAPKLSHLPPSIHVPSLEGNVSTAKEETPAILSMMKDTPNVMTSSVILSSLHSRRMSAKSEGGLLGASFNKDGVGGASSLHGRRQSQGVVTKVKGMVDEASVFTLSGSELIRSKTITAVSMGTNHTALVTSTCIYTASI